MLENGQRLLTHTHLGQESHQQFFYTKNSKIVRNSAYAPYNFRARGSTSRNFSTWRAARRAWQFKYNFWRNRPPSLKFGRAKKVQN